MDSLPPFEPTIIIKFSEYHPIPPVSLTLRLEPTFPVSPFLSPPPPHLFLLLTLALILPPLLPRLCSLLRPRSQIVG
ncbi:hypothetical protein Pmani_004116 [Petrolisthes manimaculis]|uniref:Uncharacterized protein n=1 Tax=Petrolisthes manimaculis TaxID=1843537 RepID=A0AAE1QH57_9EUCA|nr:hypothetical protein Pmani_004116 [Petrolisthes manimaculis]